MKTNSYALIVVFAMVLGLNILVIPELRKTYSQTNETNVIPNAESVFQSESMNFTNTLPARALIMVLIPNEAHESFENERHKLITDHNPYFIPTNLVIPEGTAIAFINADAPGDSPNPHTINVKDSQGEIVYSTEVLQYTNSSEPKILDIGKYSMMDTKNEFMKGTITVTTGLQSVNSSGIMNSSNSSPILGGFYTPTNQVEDKTDNDGGFHPGWLGYYKEQYPKNGFSILSEYNFTDSTCEYCPYAYWPDNKTGNHTLIIYSTDEPLSLASKQLKKMIRDNVYI
jgi:hypothetical protein